MLNGPRADVKTGRRASEGVTRNTCGVGLHRHDVYNRPLDTEVCWLRRKLETDPTDPRYMCTERGVGYLFGVALEAMY